MEQRFDHYKWITLISFALMYNFVYLGRFNVNNNMDNFAADAGMNETHGSYPVCQRIYKLCCR